MKKFGGTLAITCNLYKTDHKIRMTDLALNINAIAPKICELVQRAGDAILEVYTTDFTVETKKDTSPVTTADVVAESIITEGLKILTPGIPIVAEEAVAAGKFSDITGGVFWLVDPLDGTLEFLERNGEFTVNIGLVSNKRPVFGVIHVPIFNQTYVGGEDLGAKHKKGGVEFQTISACEVSDKGLKAIVSRRHGNVKEISSLLNGQQVSTYETVGSSLKFCQVAKGEADVYPRYGCNS